jgi:mannan endo-1,6-alpha-mannosidase
VAGRGLVRGLIDYWAYTKDNSYTDEIGQAIVSQAAPTRDFDMPSEHSGMGNDDEGFWALAAMSALEEGFPVPQGYPPSMWEQLTVNTFHDYVSRWQTNTCNGG